MIPFSGLFIAFKKYRIQEFYRPRPPGAKALGTSNFQHGPKGPFFHHSLRSLRDIISYTDRINLNEFKFILTCIE